MPYLPTPSACKFTHLAARQWSGLVWAAGTAAAALALVSGCTPMQHDNAHHNTHTSPAEVTTVTGMPTGHARLLTAEGAPAGTATLRSVQGGVEIVLQVQGMSAGTHGFHIHEKGECAPASDAKTGKAVAFGAAGGHFDPYNTHHHGQPGQSPHQVHAGDTPNLVVDASGQGTLRYTNTAVTLTPGIASIAGRSLVVHENQDDYTTNPAGNSGARIACGVISITPGNRADAGTAPAVRMGS